MSRRALQSEIASWVPENSGKHERLASAAKFQSVINAPSLGAIELVKRKTPWSFVFGLFDVVGIVQPLTLRRGFMAYNLLCRSALAHVICC